MPSNSIPHPGHNRVQQAADGSARAERAAPAHYWRRRLAKATGLQENAGVLGSTYGDQIINDFAVAEYDGPCPPPVTPFVHEYLFTVYALDKELNLPSSTNFPANSETLYQALIHAGRHGHILASARLVGFYSTARPN
jgi:phosphatidylethanolamine-binding protein (PEBP) family uncharacterized protein